VAEARVAVAFLSTCTVKLTAEPAWMQLAAAAPWAKRRNEAGTK